VVQPRLQFCPLSERQLAVRYEICAGRAGLAFGRQLEDRDNPVGALLVLGESRGALHDDRVDAVALVSRQFVGDDESQPLWRARASLGQDRALPLRHWSHGTLQSPFCRSCNGWPPVLRTSTTSPGTEKS
jgi:hypothetical protein